VTNPGTGTTAVSWTALHNAADQLDNLIDGPTMDTFTQANEPTTLDAGKLDAGQWLLAKTNDRRLAILTHAQDLQTISKRLAVHLRNIADAFRQQDDPTFETAAFNELGTWEDDVNGLNIPKAGGGKFDTGDNAATVAGVKTASLAYGVDAGGHAVLNGDGNIDFTLPTADSGHLPDTNVNDLTTNAFTVNGTPKWDGNFFADNGQDAGHVTLTPDGSNTDGSSSNNNPADLAPAPGY
jgi:hypothetical protein